MPWYFVEVEYDFSESPATIDNPGLYTDQTVRDEFLVDELWVTRTSLTWDTVQTRTPYSSVPYYSNVEGLFDKMGILCYASLVSIAISVAAIYFASKGVTAMISALAIGLLVGTLLVFSLSFPEAVSDDWQGDFLQEIEGLYGSDEGSYVDDYFDVNWKAKWQASYAWWLLAAASSMMLVQIILLLRCRVRTETPGTE